MYRFRRDLLLIDVESTGVEPHHVICQWGSILLDKDTLEEKSRFSTLVLITPNDLALATPEAMAVHNIPPQDLTDPTKAMHPHYLVREIDRIHGDASNYDVYGMNVSFDTDKLKSLCKRYYITYPFDGDRPTSCRQRDVQDFLVIYSSLTAQGWAGAGLRSMCDKHNITYPENHSAVGDCEIMAKLIRKIGTNIQNNLNLKLEPTPNCGCKLNAPMVLRSNARGKFWGCSKYGMPNCPGHTKRLKK